MSGPVSDAVAELIAMRAAGEITPDEFNAARGRLRGETAGAAASEREAPFHSDPQPAALAAPEPVEHGVRPSAAPKVGFTAKKPFRLGRKALLVVGGLLFGILALGSIAGQKHYKRADYGAAWPYPAYDSATVRCTVKTFGSTDRPVATVELGGVTYGLNGPALGVGGYPDPRPFEPSDKTAILATRQAMINDALTNLCRWRQ